jgi:hypothetical protein
MLMMIYDAKGEPFEVRPELAKKLIINEGWNASPPVETAAPACRDGCSRRRDGCDAGCLGIGNVIFGVKGFFGETL